MRVVHVAPRFPPAEGGGERHVARLAAALAARGHEVHVLTTDLASEVPFRRDPALPAEERAGQVHVHRLRARRAALPVWGYGYRAPGLLDEVARLEPQVVHAHGYGYRHSDLLARARPGAPWRLVLTSHGFVAGRGPLMPLKALYDATRGRRTVHLADACIAIAPPDASAFEDLGARRVEVVPNGVEYARFAGAHPDARLLARLGVAGEPYVAGVSRLERIKGQDLLLEAFARVAPEHPGLRLVLAGEGAAEGAYRALAGRLGVDRRVAFAGRLSDDEVASLLRGATVFAHAAREEPFGIVLLEAMAAGAPVLATHVGGIPYVAGDAAMLVAPRADALAQGLGKLLEEESLRGSYGALGRERARGFSWESNAAKVEALYRRLLAA